MPTVLEVTPTVLEVTPTVLEVAATVLEVTATVLEVAPTVLEVTPTVLEVTPTVLEVTATALDPVASRAGHYVRPVVQQPTSSAVSGMSVLPAAMPFGPMPTTLAKVASPWFPSSTSEWLQQTMPIQPASGARSMAPWAVSAFRAERCSVFPLGSADDPWWRYSGMK